MLIHHDVSCPPFIFCVMKDVATDGHCFDHWINISITFPQRVRKIHYQGPEWHILGIISLLPKSLFIITLYIRNDYYFLLRIENLFKKNIVQCFRFVVVVFGYVVLLNVEHNDENREVSKMPNEILVRLKHKQEN